MTNLDLDDLRAKALAATPVERIRDLILKHALTKAGERVTPREAVTAAQAIYDSEIATRDAEIANVSDLREAIFKALLNDGRVLVAPGEEPDAVRRLAAERDALLDEIATLKAQAAAPSSPVGREEVATLLARIVEECGNTGFGNPIVNERMIERIHDDAVQALALFAPPALGGWRPATEKAPDGVLLTTGHDFGDPDNPRHYVVSEALGGEFYDPDTGDDHGFVTHWQPIHPPQTPAVTEFVTDPDDEACPICAVPFKPDDLCLSDIDMGDCHAKCLEGSPRVSLETGELLPEDAAPPVPYRRDGAPPAPKAGE